MQLEGEVSSVVDAVMAAADDKGIYASVCMPHVSALLAGVLAAPVAAAADTTNEVDLAVMSVSAQSSSSSDDLVGAVPAAVSALVVSGPFEQSSELSNFHVFLHVHSK